MIVPVSRVFCIAGGLGLGLESLEEAGGGIGNKVKASTNGLTRPYSLPSNSSILSAMVSALI